MKNISIKILLFCFPIFCVNTYDHAIYGIVRDTEGSRLRGVVVTVNKDVTDVTDEYGGYIIDDKEIDSFFICKTLGPGTTLTVKAELAGFQTFEETLEFESKNLELNITLQKL